LQTIVGEVALVGLDSQAAKFTLVASPVPSKKANGGENGLDRLAFAPRAWERKRKNASTGPLERHSTTDSSKSRLKTWVYCGVGKRREEITKGR